MVNSGSGWTIDTGAAAAIGSILLGGRGLADPAGCLTAEDGRIFERQSAGRGGNQPTPTPGSAPRIDRPLRGKRSLSLHRLWNACRKRSRSKTKRPPARLPATLRPVSDRLSEKGVLAADRHRWSDEEHELQRRTAPAIRRYDSVYQPDPVAAVGNSPAPGWAVGGIHRHDQRPARPADVWRYPADGTTPTGGHVADHDCPGNRHVRVGGGAQCPLPALDRAEAPSDRRLVLHA